MPSRKPNRVVKSLTIPLIASAILIFWPKVDVRFSRAQAQTGNWSQSIRPDQIHEEPSTTIKRTKNIKDTRTAKVATGRSYQVDRPVLSADAIDVVCKFKEMHRPIPHEGYVQIFAASMAPIFSNEKSNILWIKSDVCPLDLYSIVHFSNNGEIELEIDCRYGRLEEIAAFSGEQGNIEARNSSGSNWNAAISGNGYFTFQCPDDEIMLSRDGRLKKIEGGYLENAQGCVLLSEEGLPWSAEFVEDGSSCNIYGDCIGYLDPSFDEIYGLQYLNSYSFVAKRSILPKDSMTKNGPDILRPRLIHNSIEDLWSPYRGRTSVSWVNHPTINFEEVDCEDKGI